jgi:hypothetical protein
MLTFFEIHLSRGKEAIQAMGIIPVFTGWLMHDLPFTNNEAARAFRMMKVHLKISGCFRTLDAARRHVRIRSYVSTLRKHGLPVLEYLRYALDGRPFLPQVAKTT